MTKTAKTERVDEISAHYLAPRRVARGLRWLFWLAAAISVAAFYTESLQPWVEPAIATGFLVVVLARFALSCAQKRYWMPRAARKRRHALLTDALGSPLSHKHTHLYYNNQFSPSIRRLGANVMENSLFSAAISGRMLIRNRLDAGGFVLVWTLAFATRHNDLTLLVVVTQIVFLVQILSEWLTLEVLHNQLEQCYERLHEHFRSQLSGEPSESTAVVLEVTISYEAAKSAASIVLSDDVFIEINPKLTEVWVRVRNDLGMDATSSQSYAQESSRFDNPSSD